MKRTGEAREDSYGRYPTHGVGLEPPRLRRLPRAAGCVIIWRPRYPTHVGRVVAASTGPLGVSAGPPLCCRVQAQASSPRSTYAAGPSAHPAQAGLLRAFLL